MFSKLNSIAFFLALWFGFLALVVSASPIVLPAPESISHLRDVVAREPIAVDAMKRDDASVVDVTNEEDVAKREPVAWVSTPTVEVEVEPRICRYSCL